MRTRNSIVTERKLETGKLALLRLNGLDRA